MKNKASTPKIKLNRSFTSKVAQSDDRVKSVYNSLKNELMSYDGLKNIVGWSRDRFLAGRKTLAKIGFKRKAICLFLAAPLDSFDTSKFEVENITALKSAGKMTCRFRITDDDGAKYAAKIIAATMQSGGLVRNEEKNDDWTLPYEDDDALIARELIKIRVPKSVAEAESKLVEEEKAGVREHAAEPEVAATEKTPAEEVIEQPAEEPAEEKAGEPAQEPTEEPTEEIVEQSVEEEVVEESAEEPTEEPAEEPTEEIVEQSVEEEVVEESAEEPTEEPAEEKPAETEPTEEIAEEPVEEVAEEHTEEVVEESAEETEEETSEPEETAEEKTSEPAADNETKTGKAGDAVISAVESGKVTADENLTDSSKYLLRVRGLKKYFPIKKDFFGRPQAMLRAVDDVSFDLERGKTLGIVGESGCGKTTMGRTILKLYQPTGGQIYFDGTDIAPLKSSKLRPLRTRMQIIFQDPYSSLPPRMPVGGIIGEAVKCHGIVPKSELHSYVLNIMDKCGLRDYYYERYPHEFSGGQRQRICIARALAVNPELIVCDEPVSALDVSIQAQIINLLKDLQQSLGLTYLFISHDLSVVKHISDSVGVMYLGSMVEFGSNERIFANPMHPYTRALFSAVPIPDPKVKMNRIILSGDIPSPANPPSGCKFHTRCPQCKEVCSQVAPAYREYEPGHFVACHLYPQE